MTLIRTSAVFTAFSFILGSAGGFPVSAGWFSPKTDAGEDTNYTKGNFRNLAQITDKSNLAIDSIDVSKDGKKLIYVSKKSEDNWDIFIRNVDSKAVMQKTYEESMDGSPSFSPDGTKFAFASDRNGNLDIFIMNAEKGMAKRQITYSDSHEYTPSWSPDGKSIVYTSIPKDKATVRGAASIKLVDVESGMHTEITSNGSYPRFSPAGDKILFQRDNLGDMKKRTSSIWLINLDGTAETQILSDDKYGMVQPYWSPDGKKVVYALTREKEQKTFDSRGSTKVSQVIEGFDIEIANIDGTKRLKVTGDEGADWLPVWSEDGYIYFVSGREGKEYNVFRAMPEFVD